MGKGVAVLAAGSVSVLVAAGMVGFLVLGAGGVTPPGCGPVGVAPGGEGGTAQLVADTGTGGLSAVQQTNATAIIGAGKGMGVSEHGIVVALAVGLQESSLRNLANDGSDPRLEPEQRDVARSLQLPNDGVGSDHGSVGIMQQQYPWWGTLEELIDPGVAAQKFYAKLLVLPDFEALPVTVAAQTVQRSAFPDAYADDEVQARSIYAQLATGAAPIAPTVAVGDATNGGAAPEACPPTGGGGATGPVGVVTDGVSVQLPAESGRTGTLTFPDQQTATAAAAALGYLGLRYSWGGGGPDGPTVGIRDGGVGDSYQDYANVGFDCSGLTEYAFAQAGIPIGGTTYVQWTQGQSGPKLSYAEALPGDLIFYGAPVYHVAIYLGQVGGEHLMVAAPKSGDVVKVQPVYTSDMVGVSRPTAKAGSQ